MEDPHEGLAKRRRTGSSTAPQADPTLREPFPYASEELLREVAVEKMPTQWQPMDFAEATQLPTGRSGHTLTLVGRRLFLVGGRVPGYRGALDIWVLDLDTKEWSRHTDAHEDAVERDEAPAHRWGHSACLVADDAELVIFGGFDHECNMNDLWALNVQSLTWRALHPQGAAPQYRAYHSAVSLRLPAEPGEGDGGESGWKMLIFGGACCVGGPYRYYQDVIMLDWDAMKWRSCKCVGDKPSGRSQHSVRLFGSSMLVFGGYNSTHVYSDVHLLDLAAQPFVWRKVPLSGPGPESLAQLIPRDFRIFPARRPLVTVGSSYAIVLGGFSDRVRALYSTDEEEEQDDLLVRDKSYPMHVLDMRRRRWWRVRGLRRGPDELMQGAAAHGSDVFLFGGTECGTDDNSLYVLDVASLFLDPSPRPGAAAPTATASSALLALSTNLRGLLEEEDDPYKDITFILEDERTVRAHKCILAARCPVLRAMFVSGMAESGANEIRIRDVSYEGFYALLQFIYSGAADISAATAQDILVVAHQYGMTELRDQCEQELMGQLLSGASIEVEPPPQPQAAAAEGEEDVMSIGGSQSVPAALVAVLTFLRLADLHATRKLAALCLDLLAANYAHYAHALSDDAIVAQAGGAPLTDALRRALDLTRTHLEGARSRAAAE